MIRFQTIDVPFPPIHPDAVRAWIQQVVSDEGYDVGELYYYFCSDETLLGINQQRLGHDFYTDIVTFPLNDDPRTISSEFCISLDRIADNARQMCVSYESELHRVLIHGVLHLIGYDDLTDADRMAMRAKEESCLKLILNI